MSREYQNLSQDQEFLSTFSKAYLPTIGNILIRLDDKDEDYYPYQIYTKIKAKKLSAKETKKEIVYQHLKFRCRIKGYCFESNKNIVINIKKAYGIKIGQSTMRKYLAELEDEGRILRDVDRKRTVWRKTYILDIKPSINNLHTELSTTPNKTEHKKVLYLNNNKCNKIIYHEEVSDMGNENSNTDKQLKEIDGKLKILDCKYKKQKAIFNKVPSSDYENFRKESAKLSAVEIDIMNLKSQKERININKQEKKILDEIIKPPISEIEKKLFEVCKKSMVKYQKYWSQIKYEFLYGSLQTSRLTGNSLSFEEALALGISMVEKGTWRKPKNWSKDWVFYNKEQVYQSRVQNEAITYNECLNMVYNNY